MTHYFFDGGPSIRITRLRFFGAATAFLALAHFTTLSTSLVCAFAALAAFLYAKQRAFARAGFLHVREDHVHVVTFLEDFALPLVGLSTQDSIAANGRYVLTLQRDSTRVTLVHSDEHGERVRDVLRSARQRHLFALTDDNDATFQ